MPRLSKLSAEQVDARTRQVFEAYLKERGNIPNMFRTMARRPDMLRTMTAHFSSIMNGGTVEKKLKEMIAVRVSYLNQCEY